MAYQRNWSTSSYVSTKIQYAEWSMEVGWPSHSEWNWHMAGMHAITLFVSTGYWLGYKTKYGWQRNRNSLDFGKKFRRVGVCRWSGIAVSLFRPRTRKTQCLEEVAATVGLRINKDKTTVMKVNLVKTAHRELCWQKPKGPVEEVEEFTYLGSVVGTTGGTD